MVHVLEKPLQKYKVYESSCDQFKMHTNILILFGVLVKSAVQAVSNVCPDLLVEYQGRCFAECPEETKLIAGSSNCTESCPESAPITFASSCIDHCPVGYSSTSLNICVKNKKPDNDPDSTRVFYRGCPASFSCDSVRPFCYKLQCFKHCPRGTKILNLQCVDICPDTKPYTLNQTCETSCPLTHKFMTDKICSSSCAEGLKTYRSRCVDDCPQGTFALKSQCVPTCPHTSPYILTIKNASSCHEQCPAYTAVNAMKCELFCPPEKPYLFNRTCVASCPIEHPYLMHKQLEYNYMTLCLGFCPEDRVLDGISCVLNCTNDMVIFNKTCVPNCPSSKPLMNPNFECVKQCSKNEYVYQSKCFRKCPSNLKIFGSTCVKDCRNTIKPFTAYSRCSSKCPEDHFSDNFTCVLICPSLRQYTFNNTCHEECPDSYPYYRPSSFSDSGAAEQYRCVKECYQGEKIYKNECVDHCPTGFNYVLNKTCDNVCPVSHPYMKSFTRGITCMAKCDQFRLVNSSYCVNTCPEGTFQYNNTCVYQCPKELPFKFGISCVVRCPKSYVLFNRSKCLLRCGRNFILERNTSECITKDECRQKEKVVFDNEFCVDNNETSNREQNQSSSVTNSKWLPIAVAIFLSVFAIICIFCFIKRESIYQRLMQYKCCECFKCCSKKALSFELLSEDRAENEEEL